MRIFSNAIYSNAELGIDLSDDGVTSNDPLDADNGPNEHQNFPQLTSLDLGTTSTVVRGNLISSSNATFRIEFFYSDVCDPTGFGEGQNFIGTTSISTDESGNVAFTRTFAFGIPSGSFVTTTATDQADNTSEFSRCIHPVAISTAEVNVDGEDEFQIKGLFVRVEGEWTEILAEDVTFTLGSFARTIPAGAFEPDDDNQEFRFERREGQWRILGDHNPGDRRIHNRDRGSRP